MGVRPATKKAETSKPPSRGPVIVLAISALVVGSAVAWTVWQARRVSEGRPVNSQRHALAWPSTRWKNAQPDVKYVGDSACARCHAEIAATFRRHPMGRSLAPIAALAADALNQPEGTTPHSRPVPAVLPSNVAVAVKFTARPGWTKRAGPSRKSRRK